MATKRKVGIYLNSPLEGIDAIGQSDIMSRFEWIQAHAEYLRTLYVHYVRMYDV